MKIFSNLDTRYELNKLLLNALQASNDDNKFEGTHFLEKKLDEALNELVSFIGRQHELPIMEI